MSDDDEFEQELKRMQELMKISGTGDLETDTKKNDEHNSNNSTDDRPKDRTNSVEKDESKEKTLEKEQNGFESQEKSDSEESDVVRNNFSPYLKRVTRNATGSLPREKKTLLEETTEEFDGKKKKSKPTRRPGYFTVLAPECTACGSDIVLRPYQRRLLIHPYLKTGVCRQCHEFYHSDTFQIDDEGSEIFCIWCGEGGKLSYCDKCEKAFCSDCLKRNFGRKVKNEIFSMDSWGMLYMQTQRRNSEPSKNCRAFH